VALLPGCSDDDDQDEDDDGSDYFCRLFKDAFSIEII
jgi:hypothetical protein